MKVTCPLRARLELGLEEDLDSEPEGERTPQGTPSLDDVLTLGARTPGHPRSLGQPQMPLHWLPGTVSAEPALGRSANRTRQAW